MKMSKKVLSILLSLMLVLGAVGTGFMSASADDDGIVWNAAENRYEISNYAGLKEFASIVNGEHASIVQNSAACAVLTQDITADGTDWTPIGPNYYGAYTGTFDGNGHVITGLSYNNTSKSFSGLFGYVGSGGKVQNVGLEGGNITGKDYDGAIAGWNEGTITNCCNTCDISGADYVGGMVGINEGTIKNCYNTGSVTSTGQYATAGGVAGRSSGTVTNCYNTGDATANGTYANATYYGGGVVGNNTGTVTNCYNTGDTTVNGTDGSYTYGGGVAGRNSGAITNCYSTGKVTATRGNVRAGGTVGGNQGTVTDSYYDKSVCNVDNGIGTALTTDQMTGSNAADNMKGLFNDDGSSDDWCITASYPRLIFKIENYDQLKAFSARVNNGETGLNAKLMNDIVATGYNDWTPIGYFKSNVDNNPFIGTFDGNGRVIIGLSNSGVTDAPNYAGLFGCVGTKTEGGVTTKGIVKNVGLEGEKITGGTYVGGVVGYNNGGSITNCYNTGDVSGNDYVGGVVGYNNGGSITNCYNTGAVSGVDYVGGVVGYNNGGSITNCYNTGAVTATATVDYAGVDAGGVAGYNAGTVTNCYNKGAVSGADCVGGVVGLSNGTVTNCYNTGNVSSSDDAGGVVGFITIERTVTNCYNTGNITATDDYADVGGIAGFISNDSTVTNCYSTGNITATGDSADVGGVAGFVTPEGKTINCHYDKTICGEIGAYDGADIDSAKGLTTDQMTGTNALDNMTFAYEAGEESPWLTKANNENSSYYPHLKGFAYDSEPTDANWPPKIEAPVTTYPLWVGGNQVTSDNMDDVLKDGTVRFEAVDGKHILTLENADITESYRYEEFDNAYTTANIVTAYPVNDTELTIVLIGENKLSAAEYGIRDSNSRLLTITGDGSLDVTADIMAIQGIDLFIDGADITAKGAGGANGDGSGIITDNLTIRNSAVSATGSEFGNGICGTSIKITDSVITAESEMNVAVASSTLSVSGNSTVIAECASDEDSAIIAGEFVFDDRNDITEPWNYRLENNGDYKLVYNADDNTAAKKVVIGKGYAVTFLDGDGETVLYKTKVLEGANPEYKGAAPTRTDPSGGYTYAFSGWKDGNNNEYAPGAAFPAAESDITYTAQFIETPVDYTVTFFVDGKQYSQSTVPFGAPVSSPRTPQKDNYDFTGWDAEIPETMPAQNLEFNAVFKAIEYTATFVDENGNTVDEVKFTVEDDSIDEPAVPEKANYTGKWEEYTLGANDITIKPVYTLGGETVVNTDSESEITTDYKESKRFAFEPKFVPDGATVHIFYNGEDRGEGTSIEVKEPTDDYTVECKVLDKDGNEIASSGEIKVKVKNSFFDRLKWFFNNFWANILKTFIEAIIKAC